MGSPFLLDFELIGVTNSPTNSVPLGMITEEAFATLEKKKTVSCKMNLNS